MLNAYPCKLAKHTIGWYVKGRDIEPNCKPMKHTWNTGFRPIGGSTLSQPHEEASEGLITGYPGGPILPKEGTCERGGG